MTDSRRRTPFIKMPDKRPGEGTGLPERWSNSKAALVGYLTGKAITSPRIAAILNDGTDPKTIRKMWKYWRLPTPAGKSRHTETFIVSFDGRQREGICASAKALGIEPEEFIRRVAYYASHDNLYQNIVDDRPLD